MRLNDKAELIFVDSRRGLDDHVHLYI